MGNILIIIAISFVALVLAMGLYTLWKGGEVAATWSNKLMRIRVLAQAVAIIIVLAVLYFGHS